MCFGRVTLWFVFPNFKLQVCLHFRWVCVFTDYTVSCSSNIYAGVYFCLQVSMSVVLSSEPLKASLGCRQASMRLKCLNRGRTCFFLLSFSSSELMNKQTHKVMTLTGCPSPLWVYFYLCVFLSLLCFCPVCIFYCIYNFSSSSAFTSLFLNGAWGFVAMPTDPESNQQQSIQAN